MIRNSIGVNKFKKWFGFSKLKKIMKLHNKCSVKPTAIEAFISPHP
jgi:hypothetical protein